MDRSSSIAETTIHLAFVTTKLCLYDRWQCISLEIKKEELKLWRNLVFCAIHKRGRPGGIGQELREEEEKVAAKFLSLDHPTITVGHKMEK